MSMTITQNDSGSVVIEGKDFADELLVFAGADTFVEGTILARSTANQNMVPFVIGGSTAGNGIPAAVLTYDVTRAGAGNTPVRVLLTGRVEANRLVVDADGDASNITHVEHDLLRTYDIIAVDVTELNIPDNA